MFTSRLARLENGLNILPDKGDENAKDTLCTLWLKAAGEPRARSSSEIADLPQLNDGEITDLDNMIAARLAGKPLAHITGTQLFMGLEFIVDASALIPRKETELLAIAAIEKIAELDRSGAGVKVIDAQSKIMKKISEEEAIEMQIGPDTGENTVFLFKHFPAQDASGFDYPPRLIESPVAYSRSSVAIGHASIKLKSSKYDSWGFVEVVKPVGAIFTVGNTSMLKGTVHEEVDSEAFKPYSYLKWDE